MAYRAEEKIPMAQTALIGQTFAMLSGVSWYLAPSPFESAVELILPRNLVTWLFFQPTTAPRYRFVVSFAQSFHPIDNILQWARRVGMMSMENDSFDLDGLSGQNLAQAWRDWARKEEMKRYLCRL
jgi:hypothetical protein